MKQKVIYFLLLSVFVNFNIYADKVSKESAKHVAKNILYEKLGLKQNELKFIDVESFRDSKQNVLFYVFNLLKPKGFVIISADDNAYPLIAYSNESNFDLGNAPPSFAKWMQNYKEQLKYIISNKLDGGNEINLAWLKYMQDFDKMQAKSPKAFVEPLLGTNTWHQDAGWNDSCPEDPAGPGGHVLAGCVATASSMIMKYYNYPYRGIGSESYYIEDYGVQTANFGETIYDWAKMRLDIPTPHAAQIQYHMGVAVHMDYGPDASYANTGNAVQALKDYFDYSLSSVLLAKDNYSNTQWETMIKSNLDDQMPLIYRGQGTGGHAFCLDGYDDDGQDGLFHFNWGWSGNNNGYYNLSSLNPGTYNFTTLQMAGFNIVPNELFEPPINVDAVVDFNDVSISWEPPNTNKTMTGYFVYRNAKKISDLLPATQTSFMDENLQSKTYIYNVIAYYESPEGISPDSKVQLQVSANYDLNISVKDQNTGSAISGANVEVYTDYPFPYTSSTNENGEASFSLNNCGRFKINVEKNGYIEFTDSIDVYEPEQNFDVGLTLGINSISKLGNRLYPNPSKGIIYLDMEGIEFGKFRITDMLGHEVLSEKFKANHKVQINLKGLSKGVYYIEVDSNNKKYVDRFVIE